MINTKEYKTIITGIFLKIKNEPNHNAVKRINKPALVIIALDFFSSIEVLSKSPSMRKPAMPQVRKIISIMLIILLNYNIKDTTSSRDNIKLAKSGESLIINH